MRRTWESLMKVHYTGDAEAIGMIDHISNRLDDIIRRRNDTVHRLWFIGYGDEETKSYEVAGSIKGTPDIGKKGRGGVKCTDKDTRDFEEVISEMQKLTALVSRFMVCVVMPLSHIPASPPTIFITMEEASSSTCRRLLQNKRLPRRWAVGRAIGLLLRVRLNECLLLESTSAERRGRCRRADEVEEKADLVHGSLVASKVHDG
jgi:hypothetical protein